MNEEIQKYKKWIDEHQVLVIAILLVLGFLYVNAQTQSNEEQEELRVCQLQNDLGGPADDCDDNGTIDSNDYP